MRLVSSKMRKLLASNRWSLITRPPLRRKRPRYERMKVLDENCTIPYRNLRYESKNLTKREHTYSKQKQVNRA